MSTSWLGNRTSLQELLDANLKMAAGYEYIALAGQTDRADIRADTFNAPRCAATGMWFAENYNVADS